MNSNQQSVASNEGKVVIVTGAARGIGGSSILCRAAK
jgi:NAD(P)-dependent dehydrogenase (short-subunit alcohol dehydrogenase family)